jgi:hypothetical protein
LWKRQSWDLNPQVLWVLRCGADLLGVKKRILQKSSLATIINFYGFIKIYIALKYKLQISVNPNSFWLPANKGSDTNVCT